MAKNSIPKLHINKFNSILALETIDTFEGKTEDNRHIELLIKKDGDKKYGIIRGAFTVIGWTEDINAAFDFWHIVDMFTSVELYDLARGKKVL